ncbi:MAG: dihydroorotase [Cyanobacteria bacterium J06597_16]
MATLIRQAYLLGLAAEAVDSVSAEGTADVLIDNGKIVAIAPVLVEQSAQSLTLRTDSLSPLLADPISKIETVDASGQFLGPGLVDLYSQSGEPGHESRETLASLSKAAAAGGFTRVGLLPNTQPAADNAKAIAAIATAASPVMLTAPVELQPWAAITLGTEGTQLTELSELAAAGALGFSDGRPIANPTLLRRLLEYAQPLNKPIALWPCNRKMTGHGVAREGSDSLRLGLSGVSALAETTALATLIECVAQTHTPVHVMRLSTARGVNLIGRAKAEGVPITASVPWHHLLFDTHDLAQYDPNLRHNPPLGTPTDREALITGIAEGVLDAIAIDHSPYTYEEKTVAFDATPPGAIGLELSLPVLWQTFVATQQWTPSQLWQALSQGPMQCLGQPPYELRVGAVAEMTLFDPRAQWIASPENLHSLASNTPWLNQPVQGKVSNTYRAAYSARS